MRILSEKQEDLLSEERKWLSHLELILVQFGSTQEDQVTLRQSIEQLDDLFLLVVVGEFNSGKSAFINALIGQKVLEEGVTPTTTKINLLRHGESEQQIAADENQLVLAHPAVILDEISIVDTPGTNAIIRQHEMITSQFVPRSDLVLFVTSADRPFTESERQFLEVIRNWGKKIVIVINKVDILNSPADREAVRRFVIENSRSLLGITPEVFLVSARKAFQAKQNNPELWEESGFGPLEAYIQATLDEKGRIQLKLLNPIGVSLHLANRYLDVVESRLDLLKDDFSMISDVDIQLKQYQEDMQRDFQFRIADVEKILLEMENRGDEFFDETFRLGKVFDLVNKSRIQQEFEHRVVEDVPQRVEQKVNELIDWLVDADLRQWQAVTDHIAARRRQHQSRIVGDIGIGSFHYDRERLMEAVGREARRVVDTFDKTREAQSIADEAQTAVATSLAIEVGAIGLGALIAALATTAAADFTGILTASLIAALGLFIIPAKRREAKADMRKKVASMRSRLVSTLRQQFEREIQRSLENIQATIAPYTRFVRAEQANLAESRQSLSEVRSNLEHLKYRIETSTA